MALDSSAVTFSMKPTGGKEKDWNVCEGSYFSQTINYSFEISDNEI